MPTALNGSEGGAVVFIQGSIIPTTGRRHNYERKARMQPVHRLVHLFASQCIARHSWPWGHLACLEQSRACVPPCRGTTQCERCPPSHAAPASLQERVADVWFLEVDTPLSRCNRRGAPLAAGTMQPLWCSRGSRPPSAAKNHGSGKLLHLSRLSSKDLAAPPSWSCPSDYDQNPGLFNPCMRMLHIARAARRTILLVWLRMTGTRLLEALVALTVGAPAICITEGVLIYSLYLYEVITGSVDGHAHADAFCGGLKVEACAHILPCRRGQLSDEHPLPPHGEI
eukprot:7391917-Prymnesium_polylepis.1